MCEYLCLTQIHGPYVLALSILYRKTDYLLDTAGVKLVDVLTQINLEIRDGDAVGIIGLNGSGKTSLLRLLSKIYEPTRGTVSVQGKTRSLLSLGAGLESALLAVKT